jgi:hypothetical protein
MNDKDRELDDGGPFKPKNQEPVPSASAPEDVRSLLDKVKAWLLSGFEQALDDRSKTRATRLVFDGGSIELLDARKFVLGLGNELVTGGSSFNIQIQPQVSFQAERLFIPAQVAQHFVVNDIKVGENSQFMSSGAIAAMVFSDANMYASDLLRLDPCLLGKEIIIAVTNIDPVQPHVFQGAIFGTSFRPSFNQKRKDGS